jgi:hypothetical protein
VREKHPPNFAKRLGHELAAGSIVLLDRFICMTRKRHGRMIGASPKTAGVFSHVALLVSTHGLPHAKTNATAQRRLSSAKSEPLN